MNNIKFSNFLISESIGPKFSKYGLNVEANDLKYYCEDDILVTLLLQDNVYYLITIDLNTGEFKFGSSPTYSKMFIDYSFNRVGTHNAFQVFSKILYIVLSISYNKKLSTICFSGLDNSLDILYSKLVKNKYFINSIKELGYIFVGKNSNGLFIFNQK